MLLPATSATAGAATTGSPVAEAGPKRMTLLDYARAQAKAAATDVTRAGRVARLTPVADYAPQAASFLQRRSAAAYLLYVSAISPSGAGSVNVYPGSVHGSHPPLIGKISGLDSPSSLAIDRFGALYVCQTDVNAPVLVFSFLSRKPDRELKTDGALPVAVTVAPSGTVYVSTAQNGSLSASILVYPPGATHPAMRIHELAGDAVASLQSDEAGHVYFAADFVDSQGYIGELATHGVRSFVHFPDDTQATSIELDAAGNVLALKDDGTLTVYAHASANVLGVRSAPDAQSLTFGNTRRAYFTASGTIAKYSYPGGALLETITSLAADNTFGLATFPRAPYAP